MCRSLVRKRRSRIMMNWNTERSFGDTLTGGVKFEDKLMINKRGELVLAEGAVIARGDVAYGGSLVATLRDKDFPLC
ncbi:translocase of chloroplast 120, chloroplastic-like protein [Tanacetum coccineum]